MRLDHTLEGVSTGSILLHARWVARPCYNPIMYTVLAMHWMMSFLYHTTRDILMYSADLIMINIMIDERLMCIFPCGYGYGVYGGSILVATFFPTFFTDTRYYILPKIGIAHILVIARMVVSGMFHEATGYTSASCLSGVLYGLYRRYYDRCQSTATLFCVLYHYMLGVVMYLEDPVDLSCRDCHGVHLLRWISWYCHALALATLYWSNADIHYHTDEDHQKD